MFINTRGIVLREEYKLFIDRLEMITYTLVKKPIGDKPDLMVYFDSVGDLLEL